MGLATRGAWRLKSDASRVVSRLFIPGQELVGGSESRASGAVERILALSELEVEHGMDDLMRRFDRRHPNLTDVFESNAERVSDYVTAPISDRRKQLLGAAFTHEYAIEGAAICNPSIVAAPDQRGALPGELRVVLSYRAIGEGHRSSIVFRSGLVNTTGELVLDAARPFPVAPPATATTLNRELFHSLLGDRGIDGETAASVLDSLPDEFDPTALSLATERLRTQGDTRLNATEVAAVLDLLAASFYQITFDPAIDLSRRVLWPAAPNEAVGMEDARFVQFDDGTSSRYLASYTAFDGQAVSQQLLETDDFAHFTSSPLAGAGARNKGLAFFPRKVNGQYLALSRFDRETNAIAQSSNGLHWEPIVTAQRPMGTWEILQLGNCGSPIELDAGWLVIIHGVGPMRTYGIGALLLDLDDPTKVIGQLPRPLLIPADDEQDGYVPNVVYSCGSLVHNETLYLPYGIADQSIGYATFRVPELLAAFEPTSQGSPRT